MKNESRYTSCLLGDPHHSGVESKLLPLLLIPLYPPSPNPSPVLYRTSFSFHTLGAGSPFNWDTVLRTTTPVGSLTHSSTLTDRPSPSVYVKQDRGQGSAPRSLLTVPARRERPGPPLPRRGDDAIDLDEKVKWVFSATNPYLRP